MHYAIKPYINKQIVKMADENLTDYSCLSRYHYTKTKKYLKKTNFPCLLGHPLNDDRFLELNPTLVVKYLNS